MAIDTAAKRHSALHFLARGVPRPDGTIDAGDRLTLTGQYRGIIGTPAPAIPDPTPDTVRLFEQPTVTLKERVSVRLFEANALTLRGR